MPTIHVKISYPFIDKQKIQLFAKKYIGNISDNSNCWQLLTDTMLSEKETSCKESIAHVQY